MFPSPIGELHFSITTHNIEDYWNNLFPSPIGELHFSIMYTHYVDSLSTGFRPLSGSYISQSIYTCRSKFGKQSFRPLSGSYISQSGMMVCSSSSFKVFPSPIGELHFSIPSPQPHVLSGTNRGIAGEK